ncbi:MAG: hypothetical protein FJ359_04870 [Thaumarchaeota archaeon]|nr:hypothetical protein [Nitrososphaerota archaeon]
MIKTKTIFNPYNRVWHIEDMPLNEVSTKLTPDELEKFLKICKNRNCTASELLKKLVLSIIETGEKGQTQPQSHVKPQDTESQTQRLDEPTVIETIQKIKNDEVNEQMLQELYVKLGEKLEKNSLTRPEETLFRMVHQKLRDKLLHNVAQTKTLTVEERFQYF